MIKRTIACMALTLLTAAVTTARAQSKTDTLQQSLSRLASSPAESDKALLRTRLYKLVQSNREKDWLTAGNFFYQLKMQPTLDSLHTAEKTRFPRGILVREDSVHTIYNAATAKEKEAAFNRWIRQFPPEKTNQDIVYDYARNNIGHQFAVEDNVPKAMHYATSIVNRPWKGEGAAGIALVLIDKGHYKEAGILLRRAIHNSIEFMTFRKNEYGAPFAAVGFVGYCTKYADLFYRQKQYDSALKYIALAHDSTQKLRGNINELYADILLAQGKDQQAFDKIDEAVKAGLATPAMKTSLRTLYVKLKGDQGFEAYLSDIDKQLTAKFLRDLPRQMIDLPAPSFTLTDLDGHPVSLDSLRGKTVVLDFWATWCGPCKASFPAMQMAVNKYRDSADVKFLFIHTWEHDDTATLMARNFITSKQYPFQVLMDLKDKTTGTNKVVEEFKVSGIPTKFVIDRNGHIRFRITGFEGGNDAAVDELSAMITLANSGSR